MNHTALLPSLSLSWQGALCLPPMWPQLAAMTEQRSCSTELELTQDPVGAPCAEDYGVGYEFGE